MATEQANLRGLSCRAFCQLAELDAEWEWCGACSVYVYEPLNIEAPADARASCCLVNQVDFYDRTGNQSLGRTHHHELVSVVPLVVHVQGLGLWFEIASGTVIYRNNRWTMRWLAYNNTRLAYLATFGMEAYHDIDGFTDRMRSKRQYARRKADVK